MHDLDYVPPGSDDRLLVEEGRCREHIIRLSDGSEKAVTGRLEVTRSMHLVVWDDTHKAVLVLKASKWDAIRAPGLEFAVPKGGLFESLKEATVKELAKKWVGSVNLDLESVLDSEATVSFVRAVAVAVANDVERGVAK